MSRFGSFDNSTCERVLDLLEPSDLTLGQVVIKRVAVVELSDCVPITAYRFCIISSLFSRIASQHSPFAVRHLYSG